jgi:2-succinyl-6-hydroxy-2,4-cyclohexadiene-1-carboxylate synthase
VRLCLVHGFTQTGASWGPVAARLRAAGHEVVTPDAPGHGRASHQRAGLWEGARLLATEVGPAVWIGYSMGGRLALHIALGDPAVVAGLVLVSATAGIDDGEQRETRRAADEALAGEVERVGVDEFVDRWLRGPMWATLPAERAGVEHRRGNTVEGLASSLRLAGTGTQEPLWGRLAGVAAPALVVTGELDAAFGALGDRLAASLPQATRVVIADAGHAVPWEQPDAFVAAVDGWLTR